MLALSALAKRSLSTAGGVVQVVKKPLGLANVPEDKQPYYGVVTMAGPPANAVDQAMVDGLLKALDELEGDKKVRGLVLTSGVKGFFTAGIDLKMFQNGTDVWTKYWLGLRQVYLRLYSSRLVSVAAINGHAPGAGTIFALACHYRFMLNGKGTIGLNEVALGLPVPKWISLRTVDVIGHRGAEKLLPLGTQVVADDAVKVGLVDQAFATEELLTAAAVAQLQEAGSKVESAQQTTFGFLRKKHADEMKADEAEDVAGSVATLNNPKFQAQLKVVLERLAAKKK